MTEAAVSFETYLSTTLCYRHCIQLLQGCKAPPKSTPADQLKHWLEHRHNPMCRRFLIKNELQQQLQGLSLGELIPGIPAHLHKTAVLDIAADFLKSGVRFSDLEWRSRASMLKSILQVGVAILTFDVWISTVVIAMSRTSLSGKRSKIGCQSGLHTPSFCWPRKLY